MSFSQQQYKDAIDSVFSQFDSDSSGSLEVGEVKNLINAALKRMNQNRQVSQAEVQQFISSGDKDGDTKIGKAELVQIFKKVFSGRS